MAATIEDIIIINNTYPQEIPITAIRRYESLMKYFKQELDKRPVLTPEKTTEIDSAFSKIHHILNKEQSNQINERS